MNERPSDPTGSTEPGRVRDSGRAGLDDPSRGVDPQNGLGGPHRNEGGEVPRDGSDPDEAVEGTERDVITSGRAATSEIGDPAAQDDAERRPGGPPNSGPDRDQPPG